MLWFTSLSIRELHISSVSVARGVCWVAQCCLVQDGDSWQEQGRSCSWDGRQSLSAVLVTIRHSCFVVC